MSWDWSETSLTQLGAFLAAHGIGSTGELPDARPIGDGHSNLTYRIATGGQQVVLRRPPPPPFPPGSNDVLREARILSALNATGYPVPRVIATGQAGELFDVPFYVMAMVDGDVITTAMPVRFATADRAGDLARELVAVQAALHVIDWRAIGLDTLGRPEGFNARHVKRMAGLMTDEDRAAFPAFTTLQQWLENNCPPESGAALIHNDCRIGNVMWSREDTPRIAAVLDWELATIGDPLLDLAYTLASLPRDGACRNPVQDLAAAFLDPGLESGLPEPHELVAHYAGLAGQQPVALNWYMAMVNWKLAILYAYSRRKGADSYYEDATQVPRFLEEARFHAGLA